MSSGKLKLDLHPVYNKGDLIDKTLEETIHEVERKKIGELQIICGKGSGQLKNEC